MTSKRRNLHRLLTASLVVLAAGALAQPDAKAPAAAAKPSKKLTLLITGDNRGEIAPCG